MSQVLSVRPSACPGLYRLAPARDGGICRIKLALGTLSAAQARIVAAAARRYGNGTVEITSRGNLQVRGVAPANGADLADVLYAAGLGAATAGADDVRNVMVSPTYGIDSRAVTDIAPVARQLLAELESRTAFHALSAKFSFLLDGGERTAPLDHPNDIWLSAVDADHFAIGLAGTLRDRPLGVLEARKTVETVCALLERFLAVMTPQASRLRQLDIEARVRLLGGLAEPASGWSRPQEPLPSHIGHQPGAAWVGARPPLGRLTPERLEGLAAIAAEEADGTLRLTPFQSVIVTSAQPASALAKLAALGLVVAPDHPLADMLACSGSSGCNSAHADTQRDAALLAGQGVGSGVHLTGCEKSCAAARAASHTLVAVAPGRYDLYRRADGAASRFGERLASGLTVAAAARKLANT